MKKAITYKILSITFFWIQSIWMKKIYKISNYSPFFLIYFRGMSLVILNVLLSYYYRVNIL